MRAIKSPLLVLFIFERHYHSDHTPCENVLNNTMAFAGITNTNPGVPAMQELPHRCIKGLNIIMGRMRRTLASAVYISTLLAAAVLWPTPLLATNYTVKSGGGGNFTTIQACANVAVAGDTCTVYAGSYAGWTQSTNGTPGNLITFTVNRTTFPTCALTTCSGPNGDVATITSGVNISGRSYIRILGFSFTSGITMDTSSSHNQIEYNSSTDIVFISLPANPGRNGSDNIVSYNKISYTPLSTPKLIGIILRGDRNLIEHNDIGFGAGDCMELGGANIVVRNNVCHDKNGRADFWGSNVEHIDFAQAVGGVSPTVSFSLFENNTEKNCTNDQNNCHFIFVRASGGEIADNIIERYNFISSSDSFTGLGDSTDGNATVPNPHVYNNTAVLGALSTSIGDCFTSNAGSGGQNVFLNNICQDANAGVSITYFGQGGLGNGNITYDTTCTTSCTWSAPYTNEATYAALHNKNPLFANYPTDGTLQVGSPAIGAGVALTTASGAGTNSTSLTVADAHFFQPGWGPSDNKVQADWIRIGASTTAQISSVNYLTNVITLANPVSWNNNDPVHLYKNSSGDVVLNGANPNIGASVVSTNVSGAPTPPTGLLASVQ